MLLSHQCLVGVLYTSRFREALLFSCSKNLSTVRLWNYEIDSIIIFIFAGFMMGRSEWNRMEKKYLVYLSKKAEASERSDLKHL
jgi:hypothetical protein